MQVICFLRLGILLLLDSESDDEVEYVYNETSHFMTSRGAYYASLHKDEDYDLYDTYDLQGFKSGKACGL